MHPSDKGSWLLISLREKYLFLEKKKIYILENIYIIEKKVSS